MADSEIEPFGRTGRWFQETYPDTPASAITAHSAYDDPDKDSVWYCTKHYRVNLYGDHGTLRIRDIHLFDETYGDLFNDAVCFGNEATYETLPWVDGNRHTGGGILAGMYILRDGREIFSPNKMTFREIAENTAEITSGDLCFTLMPDRMDISAPWDFTLEQRIGNTNDHVPEMALQDEKNLLLQYDGHAYRIHLVKGKFTSPRTIDSEDGKICMEMHL